MKAAVRHQYGPPSDLRLEEIPCPTPASGEVLLRVRAVSLNTSDVESMTGWPLYARVFGLFRPKFLVLGTDVSGVVEAVGPGVSDWAVGDEVMGDMMYHGGALATHACVPVSCLLKKPVELSFEQASTFPQAGAIAMQGILSVGNASAGTRVLINGAGGGTGAFAIQLAKKAGAHVTAVDNELKLEFMRSLGADDVVNYREEDVTQKGAQFDLILDLACFRSPLDYRRVLAPKGKYLMVGGAVRRLLQVLVLGPFFSRGGRVMKMLGVEQHQGVAELVRRCVLGAVETKIDRVYGLDDAAEALAQVAEGRACGKLVVVP